MKRYMALGLLALLIIGLVACTEDYSAYGEQLVGEWKTTADPQRYELFVFNADGSGTYTVVVGDKKDLTFDFTYTLEGNTLVRKTGDDEVTNTVLIKDGVLTLAAGIDKVVLHKAS